MDRLAAMETFVRVVDAGSFSRAANHFPGRRPAPATMVIFGAAGDLTKRLVVPALYNLVRGGKLPEGFAMIGIDRNDETTEAWRSNLTNMIQAFARAGGGERQALDEQAWASLVNRLHYTPRDFTPAETYVRAENLLNEQCGRQGG